MDETIIENQKLSFGAVISIAALSMSFGANAVAIKISLQGMGAFTAAGLRFSIATLTLIIWAFMTGRSLKIKKGQALKLFVISFLFTLQLGLFYFGLSKTNVSRGTLLANLQPFMVLILAHFFIPGDRITARKIVGIIMGFIGVLFIVLEGKQEVSEFRTGDLLVFSAVIVWACNSVYTKKIISEFRSFHLVLYPMIFSIPVFFIAALLWDGQLIGQVDFYVTAAMLYQGIITASFGYVAWNAMLKKYGAVSMNSFIFLLPVTGVSLGGLILGETVKTGNMIFALCFITSGILILHAKFEIKKKN